MSTPYIGTLATCLEDTSSLGGLALQALPLQSYKSRLARCPINESVQVAHGFDEEVVLRQ